MKQFGKIFSFEMKYYLKNKVFVGVTIFLVALIAVVMFFPRLAEVFGSDDGPAAKEIMLVKTPDAQISDVVQAYFTAAFEEYDVKVTSMDEAQIREQIRNKDAYCAFVLAGLTEFTYYVDDLTMYDVNCAMATQVLQRLYQYNAMLMGGMTPEQADGVMNVQIVSHVTRLGVDQMENYWYTYIMIFALYMVIALYGQMVATNVATEKSSRAMELLITSANPTSMMFGKVLASCLAGFLQIVAIFGASILCYHLNKSYWSDNPIMGSIFDMPLVLVGYMLLYFVLGFLTYGFLYGAIGSTASKLEDINTSVTPITMLSMISFMVVTFSMSAGDVNNTVMKVCSFIPFSSSVAMFTRIALTTVPWYEIAISVGILVATVVGIGVLSAKIYRVGVLLYGNQPNLGEILKMIKKA